MIRYVQDRPQFVKLLDRLRTDWRPEAFIHFDLKWENCLVNPRRNLLKIVDWEFAGPGDPAWDMGCLFADGLISVLETNHRSREARVEHLQAALRALWAAYAAELALPYETAVVRLLRATRLAGARIIEQTYAEAQQSFQLDSSVAGLLDLSLRLLERPEESTVRMLGIPLTSPP
jgi:thiamine kinase-like enzyme